VTPQQAVAKFNIRYSSDHSAESLKTWLTQHFDSVGGDWSAEWFASADPFVTAPGQFTDLMVSAITEATGRTPALSTSGGTSDARFISAFGEVVEFGLIGQTMHQVDEHTNINDLDLLTQVYGHMLRRYFSQDSAAVEA